MMSNDRPVGAMGGMGMGMGAGLSGGMGPGAGMGGMGCMNAPGAPQDGTEVARLSCPFDLECACPWKLRRIRHSTSNGYRYDLEFADHAHADHHSRTSSAHGQRHQLSKRIKGLIDSPTKILAKPRQLVQALRSQANVTAQDVPLIVAERFRLLQ